MAVDVDKMRKEAKKKGKRKRPRPDIDWDAVCQYDGDGDTTWLQHDGAHYMTDKSVLLRIDGSKYFVPFSQIYDADDEAVTVTEWWWGVAEAVD